MTKAASLKFLRSKVESAKMKREKCVAALTIASAEVAAMERRLAEFEAFCGIHVPVDYYTGLPMWGPGSESEQKKEKRP